MPDRFRGNRARAPNIVRSDEAVSSLAQSLDAPLVVVTTASHDQRAGCVIGFHTQCSIEPVRYAVWLSKANFTYRVALFATHVAIHFLDQRDRDLAELFGTTSGDEVDKFASCEWRPGPSGVPLLVRVPHRIVLERTTLWDDGSDHVCLIGTPLDVQSNGDFIPLRLSAVGDLDAAHDATERNVPHSLHAGATGSD